MEAVAYTKTLLEQVSQLEEVLTKLGQGSGGSAPSILVRPTATKAQEIKVELARMLKEAKASIIRGTNGSENSVTTLVGLVAGIAELIAKFKTEVEAKPWENPATMADMRQTVARLSSKVVGLHSRQRAQFPVDKDNVLPEQDMLQGVRAGDGYPQTCDFMHFKVGHVIHAAGVQALVNFHNHTPAKFAKIFACKAQAAWNMHQHISF